MKTENQTDKVLTDLDLDETVGGAWFVYAVSYSNSYSNFSAYAAPRLGPTGPGPGGTF